MNPTLYVNPMERYGDEWSDFDDEDTALLPTYPEQTEEGDEFLCDFLSFPM